MWFKQRSADNSIQSCPICGGKRFVQHDVLWKDLIDQWELQRDEVIYINRQQGLHCRACKNNLRSMGLAAAIMSFCDFDGLFSDLVGSEEAKDLKVLEINEAGTLHRLLKTFPGHQLAQFPDVDMQDLPFDDEAFDLVIHSDTLEHIPDPVKALSECRRILRDSAACIFTIPIVSGRLTRRRVDLPESYHGSPDNPEDCLVHTEYGADFWVDIASAGFKECRHYVFEFPAALPIIAVR